MFQKCKNIYRFCYYEYTQGFLHVTSVRQEYFEIIRKLKIGDFGLQFFLSTKFFKLGFEYGTDLYGVL